MFSKLVVQTVMVYTLVVYTLMVNTSSVQVDGVTVHKLKLYTEIVHIPMATIYRWSL